ncbi:hypothetical protein EWB00_001025, partial [Schistosoma japonicum]
NSSESAYAINCKRKLDKLVDFHSECIGVRRSRFRDSFNNDTFNIVLAAVIMCLIGGMQALIEQRFCYRLYEETGKLVDFDSDCIDVRRSRFCDSFNNDTFNIVLAAVIMCLIGDCIGVIRCLHRDAFRTDTVIMHWTAVFLRLTG